MILINLHPLSLAYIRVPQINNTLVKAVVSLQSSSWLIIIRQVKHFVMAHPQRNSRKLNWREFGTVQCLIESANSDMQKDKYKTFPKVAIRTTQQFWTKLVS